MGKDGTFSNNWYEGTLVLKNKDTLTGVIKFESPTKNAFGLGGSGGNNKVFFKKDINVKKKIKYKKDQVQYFIIKNNYDEIVKYAYLKVSKKRIKLFQVLIEGDISLYFQNGNYNMPMGGSGNGMNYERNMFYVKKKNEKFVSNRFLENAFKSFKKTAIKYFSDCKKVVNKVQDGTYKSENLYDMVLEYNKCE